MTPAWFVTAALAVGLTLIAAPAGSRVPPRASQFRVNVEGVHVDVLVMDGKRPVLGLAAADFELRDAGVLQTIDSVALEDIPLSIVMALDTSGSVKGERLVHLKEAARSLIDLLQPADRAALLTFSADVRLRSGWSGDRRQLQAAVESCDASGATSLNDAAYAALTLRDPRPGRTLVLVFSDGDDTSSWLPGANALDVARRNDGVVYAVTLESSENPVYGYLLDFRSGLQAPANIPEFPEARSKMSLPNPVYTRTLLDALSSETGGKIVNAERSSRLRETFVDVVTEFRNRYLITYSPRGVEKGGWHPIEVRLRNRPGKITARKGYLR